jgi:hypothetical protein
VVLGRLYNDDTHADSLVYMNNPAIGHKRFIIAGDRDFEEAVCGKGVRGVYVTSPSADFCHSSHDAHGAPSFDEFRDGKDRITRRGAPIARPVRIRSR